MERVTKLLERRAQYVLLHPQESHLSPGVAITFHPGSEYPSVNRGFRMRFLSIAEMYSPFIVRAPCPNDANGAHMQLEQASVRPSSHVKCTTNLGGRRVGGWGWAGRMEGVYAPRTHCTRVRYLNKFSRK